MARTIAEKKAQGVDVITFGIGDPDLPTPSNVLDKLWEHSTKPEFCYRHKWKIGQVVAWDNRMMLHMRHPVDESLDRFMWRTQTKGEAVIPVS